MSRIKINDGLNKWQRYRLKDVNAYRKKKAAYARTTAERAKRNEYMRGWRERNRDRHNRLARESHKRNRHKHLARDRAYHLKIKFNLTPPEYEKMLIEQEGKCKICGRGNKTSSRRLAIDHCHKTGEIRGLLCGACNTKLGWHEKFIEQILQYLKD